MYFSRRLPSWAQYTKTPNTPRASLDRTHWNKNRYSTQTAKDNYKNYITELILSVVVSLS